MKSEKVEFPPPAGAQLPEGVSGDKDWDKVCSFRIKDGKICMTKFGETPMPGYEKGSEKAEKAQSKPNYKDYASGISQGISGGTEGGGY